jgi:GNAT superfamily N-acetyltransferase
VIDAGALLAAYDELRGQVPSVPAGVCAERDGPLVRTVGWPRGGLVEYRDLAGLEGAALDELIARQVRIFAVRGESFEWKLHGHDRPADLPDRLRAAGFAPQQPETVLAARAVTIAGAAPALPADVALRAVAGVEDFDRIAAMEARIWGADHSWLGEMLARRLAFDPASLTVYVAEAAGEVVSAAWVRFRGGTFATLHGGGTLPEWRGRGIYRALVAERARLALERGYARLAVDTSDVSRPILERLGFAAITTTTPYIWSPVRFAP